jgi:hypothetical protein
MFKVTEEALEQEVASIIANQLGCQWATQGGVKKGQFDILLFINDLKFVLELEIGKGFPKFAEGIVQANGYKERLNADGIVILMYPEQVRKIVTSQQDITDIALGFNPQALILSSILNDSYKEINIVTLAQILKAQAAKAILTVSPNLVVNALRDCVQSISLLLKKKMGISMPSVDPVVGSFDLFKILAGEEEKIDKKKERELQIATCDLTSYILINQLLLYQLLSTPLNLSPMKEVKSFSELSRFLKEVTDVNYKAVYSVDVIQTLPATALTEINTVIIALRTIKPEYIPHDLLGRVFHEFLPFETRKLLGAFYTKPIAAEILAGITIDKGNEIVIDPACGSGTLAVAAYRHKMFLDPQRSHRNIVEKEIIGIDIMPFAAHLAALNLTLQNVLQTTDKTQVGIGNSLDIKPGNQLSPLPRQLKMFAEPVKTVDTDILRNSSLGFKLPSKIDSAIMNPPFTRKERLTQEMKGIFLDSFKKPQNYWAYFLAFSDGLLDKGGKIGAVLPRDFIAGQYSEDVREWLFKNENYNLRYIVKTVNEIAFSENARFRDFLVVLEKAHNLESCGVIYLKKKQSEMSIEEAREIALRIRKSPEGRIYEDDDIFTYWVKQKDIIQSWKNLLPFVGISQPRNIKPINKFRSTLQEKTKTNLVPLRKANVKVIRGIEPVSEGLLSALFVMRPIHPKRLGRSLLILQKEGKSNITAGIKETGAILTIPKKIILPGLKTHAYVNRYDIGPICDWMIQEDFDGFEKVRRYTATKRIDFGGVKNQISKRISYLFLSRRINFGAPGTKVLSFYSDFEMIPGKAFWSLTTDIDRSKIYCVWFNSIISIIQMLLTRTETEGGWCELTEEIVLDLDIPSHKFISEKRDQFLKIFETFRNIEWPSLIEQFKEPFSKRIEFDEGIFKILGFTQKEIKNILPDLYAAITDELTTLKRAMGIQRLKGVDSQLEFDMD